ncbi:MAG: MgtC/SapB family protein [Candidatus Omnitrophica bacterium]|nr:MgtC/SapB family protein [Candidatus Omnitrophota bacterium]
MVTEWTLVSRLILAAILSGAIGFEREFHGRAAGFRTHILLCVGSTLIMLTSMHMFDLYIDRSAIDPGRIAAGVITGIGFLGAGTIIHSRASIRGLTTAASLWVVAGIGLAVGSGLFFGSIVTTILTIMTLMLFSRFEHMMIRKDWYRTIAIETKEGIDQLKSIRAVLNEWHVEITDFEVDRSRDSVNMLLRLGLKMHSHRHGNELIEDIGRLSGVTNVKWEMN